MSGDLKDIVWQSARIISGYDATVSVRMLAVHGLPIMNSIIMKVFSVGR